MTPTKHTTFSPTLSTLLKQLGRCDEAQICGLNNAPDLEHNWGVDCVRKLRNWDVPGYLSANAFPILQEECERLYQVSQKTGDGFLLKYVSVISGEDSWNDIWRAQFDSLLWYTEWPDMAFNNDNSLRRVSIPYAGGSIITIPMYAEGFNCYLTVRTLPEKGIKTAE